MTRGTFYLVTGSSTVLGSLEFNGDMYPEGYGDDALRMLRLVSNEKEFEAMVEEFNSKRHNYEDEQISYAITNMFDNDSFINFNENYFERFFSDWIFIKNLSSKEINFIDGNDKKDIIKVGETIRLNFGKISKYSHKTLLEMSDKYTIYGTKKNEKP